MRTNWVILAATAVCGTHAAVTTQPYVWTNVKIGGGGGFVSGIVFNTARKGLAYLRTDIGGAYRLNRDDSWKPLLDFTNDTTWNYMGVDSIATDPIQPENLYIAVGLYTNSWDGRNGTILKSKDRGESFTFHTLPFKVGGNMPGRGMGERLVIDPNNNNVLYFGARSGNGLWRSTDAGSTWKNVTSFPSVGTFIQDPTDASGYNSDIMGIAWITFDANSKSSSGSSRVFVGVATGPGEDSIFVSEDGGSTWSAIKGQDTTFIPHHGVLSPAENALYVTYSNAIGPFDGTQGIVSKYDIGSKTWAEITPPQGKADNSYGYGGLAVDLQKPGTIMVAALNQWWPDANIYRSTDGGKTWSGVFDFGYPAPDYQPTVTPYYNRDVSKAPWISTVQTGDSKLVGWSIESLVIDPFDSDHWLYGTGLTLFGGHDLTNWDQAPRKNVTIQSLADGIEETAVTGLTSPPTGPLLISTVGDVGGFVHTDLAKPPTAFTNPTWFGTARDVDHAGAKPENIVRLADYAGTVAVATSSDGGVTWTPHPAVPDGAQGGRIALSAHGDTIVWNQASGLDGVFVSKNSSEFVASQGVPSAAIISADKLNNTVFYAASEASFLVSVDGGSTFKQTATLGTANSASEIAASPFLAGELFVSNSNGIWHSKDYGRSFTGLKDVTQAWGIAVGPSKTTGGPPSLFAAATINGVNTLYRTDNLGVDWATITSPSRGLMLASSMALAADPRTYSQIYVGTNGRGIYVGHA